MNKLISSPPWSSISSSKENSTRDSIDALVRNDTPHPTPLHRLLFGRDPFCLSSFFILLCIFPLFSLTCSYFSPIWHQLENFFSPSHFPLILNQVKDGRDVGNHLMTLTNINQAYIHSSVSFKVESSYIQETGCGQSEVFVLNKAACPLSSSMSSVWLPGKQFKWREGYFRILLGKITTQSRHVFFFVN